MPMYEYFCKTCDSTFELLQPMEKMKVETECPEGHVGARKVLSVFASVTKPDHCMSRSPLPSSGCGAGNCCSMN